MVWPGLKSCECHMIYCRFYMYACETYFRKNSSVLGIAVSHSLFWEMQVSTQQLKWAFAFFFTGWGPWFLAEYRRASTDGVYRWYVANGYPASHAHTWKTCPHSICRGGIWRWGGRWRVQIRGRRKGSKRADKFLGNSGAGVAWLAPLVKSLYSTELGFLGRSPRRRRRRRTRKRKRRRVRSMKRRKVVTLKQTALRHLRRNRCLLHCRHPHLLPTSFQ